MYKLDFNRQFAKTFKLNIEHVNSNIQIATRICWLTLRIYVLDM